MTANGKCEVCSETTGISMGGAPAKPGGYREDKKAWFCHEHMPDMDESVKEDLRKQMRDVMERDGHKVNDVHGLEGLTEEERANLNAKMNGPEIVSDEVKDGKRKMSFRVQGNRKQRRAQKASINRIARKIDRKNKRANQKAARKANR